MSSDSLDSTHCHPLVLTLSCPDRPGIVHAVAGLLAEHGGNITESQQFGDPLSGLFFMRVQVTAATPRVDLEAAFDPVARRFEMDWSLDVVGRPVRTLVMGSTAAHCLNDLAFRQRSENLPVELVAVVSNHTALRPLAEFYGIPFHHVPVTSATKAQAEARLLELVEELDVELVVLARYMQILSDDLCRALAGRVINIHHSFLPSFKGARPYAQAHDRGRQAHRRHRALRHGRPRRGPDHRAGRRARRPQPARRGPGRARAGRGAACAGAGGALARGAPGPARRAPHDRVPLSRPT